MHKTTFCADHLDGFPIDVKIDKVIEEKTNYIISQEERTQDFTLMTSSEYKQTLQEYDKLKSTFENYNMDFMLDRLYTCLAQSTTESRTTVDPPKIVVENKRTCILNYKKICVQLNRDNNHLKEYIENQFSVKSNINANGSLILIGVFKSNNVIAIIKKYISENIACKECKSCLTEIIKENRINYLKCNRCLSKKAIS